MTNHSTWPDGREGEKEMVFCLECGASAQRDLDGNVEFLEVCIDRPDHGPTQAVSVLPASLADELAEALERWACGDPTVEDCADALEVLARRMVEVALPAIYADLRERVEEVRRELQRRATEADAEERRHINHGINAAGPHSAMRAYEKAVELLDTAMKGGGE